MRKFDINEDPHRRYNPLINEWVLVSPHRAKRPWQGQNEVVATTALPSYDPECYLCPGNVRANGEINEQYENCFVFDNDFAALKKDEIDQDFDDENIFFKAKSERGISKVVCFSPNHNLTLPELSIANIENVIEAWQTQYALLGSIDYINYVQIFENKGSVMGCSNPHPHGQIWAQSSLPTQVEKTHKSLGDYFNKNNTNLLLDYLNEELKLKERIFIENESFVALVPFWAIWPFETMIVPKRHVAKITDLTEIEKTAFATILKQLTIKYDNLFNTSFPYSSGIHQAPTNGDFNLEWQLHMHFYPPLLRSATVKKFMVGYEMMGESQRDITPEKSAAVLKALPEIHYKNK
jgi:UDPglucose--hexose-1-phosphate uridylyltransferase